jgi:hypothetical protein
MVEHLFNPNDILPEGESVRTAAVLQLHAILYERIDQATRARSPRPLVSLNKLNEAKRLLTEAVQYNQGLERQISELNDLLGMAQSDLE